MEYGIKYKMSSRIRYLLNIFLVFIFSLFLVGCSSGDELNSNDTQYLKYLEEENKQLRQDLELVTTQSLNEDLNDSVEDNENSGSNIEDNKLDELQIRYSMFENSCNIVLKRTLEDLDDNLLYSTHDIKSSIELIKFVCDEQYELDFKKFEDSEDLLDEIENVINDLELEEEKIEELKTSNCIDEALDLEEEVEENNSNTDFLDYMKKFQRIKLDCKEEHEIDSNEFDEIIENIDENIDEKLGNETSLVTNNELDTLKEEIKNEIKEELKKDEENKVQIGNINTCFSDINNTKSNLNSNIFLIDINQEKSSIENIENMCEEYFDYNLSLRIEFKNLEKLFNQTKETISLSKHNSIIIEENKRIVGASNPSLHGLNVTWLVNVSIFNLNETNDMAIKNFRVWVARRDVIPVGDPMTIAEDSITNKTLTKNLNEIILEANSSSNVLLRFNYSELSTPIVYSNYNGFEVLN